jgi:hypothetical protein
LSFTRNKNKTKIKNNKKQRNFGQNGDQGMEHEKFVTTLTIWGLAKEKTK